jgi:hypothetical protein
MFLRMVLVLVLVNACTKDGSQATTVAKPVSDIVFLESTSAPVRLSQDGARLVAREVMVVTVKVATTRDTPVRVRTVEPVKSHIEVKYLGYSHCRPGCVGGGVLSENKETVANSIEGQSPVLKPDAEDTSLVFTLAVTSEDGIRALAESCELRLAAIPLRLSDGTIALVGPAEGGYVLGVHIADDGTDPPSGVNPRCFHRSTG